MPTARELLEQADALMRRTRVGSAGHAPGRTVADTDPPAVSPTSGLPLSARTIQREPIAPSVAGTSLPVDLTLSQASSPRPRPGESPLEPPLDAPAEESPPDIEAEFPLLTEAVDEPGAAVATPLADLADDVPLLTDAVEEIDVGIVDEAAGGEPSIWELTTRGEASVLGPTPDSIVVVPPPDDASPAVPQPPPEGRDPLGLDQPPLGDPLPSATDETVQDRIETPDAIPPPQDDARKPGSDADELSQPAAQQNLDADELSQPAAQHLEPLGPEPPPSTTRDIESEDADEPNPVVSFSIADRTPEDAQEAMVGSDSSPAETPPAVQSTLPTPLQGSNLDQQQIREIAEEIGMQVLQRIDIFTDTTLRAQLAERLRPVVDRAAADLVASINQHVGELLRAYVSEAIEREIESWRERNRS